MIQLVTKTPSAQIVTATKEIIDGLIALDIHNRPQRARHVEYLKNDIVTGNWRLTNQGVGTTVSGWLCDGGHRMAALKNAGYPAVQFLLVTGLSDDSQARVDQHAKRNMADTIGLLLDVRLTNRVVSVLRTIWNGRRGWRGGTKEPIHEIVDLACEFSTSIEDLSKVADITTPRSAMSAAFVEYYHYGLSKDEIAKWVSQIVRGTELRENTPEFVANRLMLMSSKFSGGGRQSSYDLYTKAIACCERHFKGEKMSKVYGQKFWTVFKVPYVLGEEERLEVAA